VIRRRARVVAVALVTFADLLAYSIAVPVLPDVSARLGASPTMIGLLFASFGVTLLGVSIPIGSLSDRIGRRWPLVAGMGLLAGSTLAFAYATSLPWLFAARLLQGAADAITWGVGFALVADLYGPSERGRVMGFVMSGSNLGFMLGPSIGGWLYENGGATVPFLLVTALAVAGGIRGLVSCLRMARRSVQWPTADDAGPGRGVCRHAFPAARRHLRSYDRDLSRAGGHAVDGRHAVAHVHGGGRRPCGSRVVWDFIWPVQLRLGMWAPRWARDGGSGLRLDWLLTHDVGVAPLLARDSGVVCARERVGRGTPDAALSAPLNSA
jgi:MFS family permease